jgi:hypothetical protein
MLILPAFAGAAASNLPVCCRKIGKHHCQMKPTAGLAALTEKCPYLPHRTAVSPITPYKPGTRQAVFAGLLAHPANSAQTEAGYRASHYRSKQKRGPPAFLS